MARNITRYGYAPNRYSNDTLVHLLRHRRQTEYDRELARGRTPDQQKAAIRPMSDERRLEVYGQDRLMTPAQRRRRVHKARKNALAFA